jgi:hypothetical protein
MMLQPVWKPVFVVVISALGAAVAKKVLVAAPAQQPAVQVTHAI